jgi:hypothetical protein
VNRGASRALHWRLPPEAPVAFFGFLLNYPWEILQAPFFAGMTEVRHWDAVRECSWATVGDAGLLVVAFWVAAGLAGTRGWIAQPRARPILAFLATGLLATVVLEWLATNVWHRWTYLPRMPTVPVLGTGLVPLLQWLILPPLLIWVVRRHLHGAGAIERAAQPRSALSRDTDEPGRGYATEGASPVVVNRAMTILLLGRPSGLPGNPGAFMTPEAHLFLWMRSRSLSGAYTAWNKEESMCVDMPVSTPFLGEYPDG